MALVEIRDGTASWTSEEFFVPPSLWGGGFGGIVGAVIAVFDPFGHVAVHVV